MKIVVEMTSEEFQEFMAWQGDKAKYEKQERKVNGQIEHMSKQILWAVEENPKKPGEFKIADQNHLAELYEAASEFFA